VNLSHGPIPEVGWPSMTMDFPVTGSVDLKTLQSETRVNFTIEQSQGGMYEIKAITPAEPINDCPPHSSPLRPHPYAAPLHAGSGHR
jgi:hypothetical protein